MTRLFFISSHNIEVRKTRSTVSCPPKNIRFPAYKNNLYGTRYVLMRFENSGRTEKSRILTASRNRIKPVGKQHNPNRYSSHTPSKVNFI